MKTTFLTTLFFSCAFAVYPQGQVYFNNRVVGSGTGAQAPLTAPIYDVNISPLAGTGFTAQLWGGPAGSTANQLVLCDNATTVFRTGGGAGFIVALLGAAIVPGVPAGPGSRATLQIRAWNNLNGTVTSWAQVLANPGSVARGASDLFTPDFDLGGGPVLPPNLIGLSSFNLVVPEPSVVALGACGLVALVLRRFRRK